MQSPQYKTIIKTDRMICVIYDESFLRIENKV